MNNGFGDQRNLNVTSKGFRIRYRLHLAARPLVFRQRTPNKTAINKDQVRIRTADASNQIRNIKVPSKAKEKDERTKRWTRGELVQGGGRHSSRGGSQELASIFRIRVPETKSHPSPTSYPSKLWLSSSSSSCSRVSFCFLILGSLKESSWAWSLDRVPIICPQNAKPPL